MRKRLRATGRYRPQDLAGLHSLFEIDDRITAPAFGFGNAAHYYGTQSAWLYLPKLRVPTLLIQAQDDPLVPFGIFESTAVRENRWVSLLTPEHGGHLGFLARGGPRFWADAAAMEWVDGLG
jgi:predicted alpha/beta-fold hydrolase